MRMWSSASPPPVSLGAEDNASPAGLAPAAPAVDPGAPGAPGSAPADPPRVPAERPGAEPVPAARHPQGLGAWEGRAGRCRGAHIAWRERPLQQVFEIGALPVLDVIDVPPAGCRLFDPPFQPEKPPRLVDVARLSRYDEHGIHPRHRNDAHDAGKWTVIVDAKNLFEFRSKSIRGFVAGRKQCVGLSGERIDI